MKSWTEKQLIVFIIIHLFSTSVCPIRYLPEKRIILVIIPFWKCVRLISWHTSVGNTDQHILMQRQKEHE